MQPSSAASSFAGELSFRAFTVVMMLPSRFLHQTRIHKSILGALAYRAEFEMDNGIYAFFVCQSGLSPAEVCSLPIG